ncbi:MAG: DinB family protein [Acidobacteriaceae bacterium]|nr:DinB family protein [Acidobacteriaceae bacterium]
MNELARALIAESAHAAPAKILEALTNEVAHRAVPGAPHTIYQELWHLAFWQQITLDWIAGIETPFPAKTTDPFPTDEQAAAETWTQVCRRFLAGAEQAANAANDPARLSLIVRCPSRPGQPVRLMSVEDQLISLAAHNAYHFGRIVLLRQLLAAWPPPSGGFSW